MTVYLYVLDTLADWETAYITSELNSRRYFRNRNEELKIVKVGADNSPVKTMGGMALKPDILVSEMHIRKNDILILPGGDTWMEEKNSEILLFAKEMIKSGKKVAAICGATFALAKTGALDNIKHTSNDKGYLKMICPEYKGENSYIEKPAVTDKNLVTATGLAPLEFSYEVFKMLDVFREETLESWYNLYKTGNTEYFHSLMSSLSE